MEQFRWCRPRLTIASVVRVWLMLLLCAAGRSPATSSRAVGRALYCRQIARAVLGRLRRRDEDSMEPEGDGAHFDFVSWVVLAAFCVGVIFVTDRVVDYLQERHDHDTPVWIQGDWLVGEYRDCQMRTKTVPENDKNIDYPDRLPRLFCGEDRNGVFDFQRESGLLSLLLPPADAKPPQEGAMYFVTVTSDELDHYFHVMPVRYFGRIDRTDKWVISWRCQRLSESLTCKALD